MRKEVWSKNLLLGLWREASWQFSVCVVVGVLWGCDVDVHITLFFFGRIFYLVKIIMATTTWILDWHTLSKFKRNQERLARIAFGSWRVFILRKKSLLGKRPFSERQFSFSLLHQIEGVNIPASFHETPTILHGLLHLN